MNCSSKFRFLVAAAALGVAALPLAIPSSAQAWWQGGVFVGIAPPVGEPAPAYPSPDYVPPQVYSAPPEAYSAPPEAYAGSPEAYSAPPQAYRVPPGVYQETPDPYESAPPDYQGAPGTYGSHAGVPPGLYCYAGPHICPLASLLPAGSNCSCPSDGGGWVGGQAG
jgi:hypothetical protein